MCIRDRTVRATPDNSSPSTRVDPARQTQRRAIGAVIRETRKRQRRTLADVATATGLSISLLSQIERGIVGPSLDSLRTIAEAFGTSPFQLLLGAADLPGQAVTVRKGGGVYLPAPEFTEFQLLSPTLKSAFEVGKWTLPPGVASSYSPVSYTHLDVYKRQLLHLCHELGVSVLH